MNKPAMLLLVLTAVLTLVSHNAHALHGPAEQPPTAYHHHATTPFVDSSLAFQDRVNFGIGAKACSVDQPLLWQGAPGSPPSLAALPAPWYVTSLSSPSFLTSFEEPGHPPAVRRAFLQVYLN